MLNSNLDGESRVSTWVTSAGFTLIEVLVALIILSIGVLGVAKLTLTATRANDSSYVRTQATVLAYEALDLMRGNRSTALANGYQVAFGATPAFTDCSAAPCTDGQTLANTDLNNWKTRLAAALPAGDGQVTMAVTGSETTATIVVQWNDEVASASFKQSAAHVAAPMTVTLETVL